MALRPHKKQPHQFLRGRTASERRTTEKRFEDILTALANTPVVGPVVEKAQFDKAMDGIRRCRSLYPEVFQQLENTDVIAISDLIRKAWDDARLTPIPRIAGWYLFEVRRLHEKSRLIKAITEPAVLQSVLDNEVRRARFVYEQLLEAQQLSKANKPVPARAMLAHPTAQKAWWEAHISEPPALTPFEQLVFHLQENLHRVRYCKNPTCGTPYFFVTTKAHKGQGQEYCSPDCVAWGKREKNKLWARKNREKGRK